MIRTQNEKFKNIEMLSSENDLMELFVVRMANVCLPRCNLTGGRLDQHLLLGLLRTVI